jgi:hypothetical protein
MKTAGIILDAVEMILKDVGRIDLHWDDRGLVWESRGKGGHFFNGSLAQTINALAAQSGIVIEDPSPDWLCRVIENLGDHVTIAKRGELFIVAGLWFFASSDYFPNSLTIAEKQRIEAFDLMRKN